MSATCQHDPVRIATMRKRSALAGLALVAMQMIAASQSYARDHHNRVRDALQHGKVLDIPQVLAITAKLKPGEVVGIELESRHRKLRFRIKVLTPSGDIRKLLIDARNGKRICKKDD